MNSYILLGCILQRFIDKGYSMYADYNKFEYVKHSGKAVTVTREKGNDTPITFAKLVKGIEAYQNNISMYDEGPTALRTIGLTHVTSPIHSLLHLLPKNWYKP